DEVCSRALPTDPETIYGGAVDWSETNDATCGAACVDYHGRCQPVSAVYRLHASWHRIIKPAPARLRAPVRHWRQQAGVRLQHVPGRSGDVR
ncbi:MAG: hypothetical protein CMM87_05700, partial [Rickettsiales bacterium]|nr:hypothetical protein [Rickettsiales bacterium]